MPKLRDIMTRELVTLAPEATLREAVELLTERHVGAAPVIAGAQVVGVVSATDLLEFLASTPSVPTEPDAPSDFDESTPFPADDEGGEMPDLLLAEWQPDGDEEAAERFFRPKDPGRDILAGHTVAEVMTRHVLALPSDAGVAEAATCMRRADVHRVLVMDAGHLLGIVSTMDIARAVAQHRLGVRSGVFTTACDNLGSR